MSQQRPFSKLKKNIESFFDEKLKMEFCCLSYPMRSQWSPDNAIPRFYVKVGKEIIWDYPKDFELKKYDKYLWMDGNGITDLVREYIDTPIDILLDKKFENDTFNAVANYPYNSLKEDINIEYKLAELFKAADRRLGKDKLLKWAKGIDNPKVDRILKDRYN